MFRGVKSAGRSGWHQEPYIVTDADEVRLETLLPLDVGYTHVKRAWGKS